MSKEETVVFLANEWSDRNSVFWENPKFIFEIPSQKNSMRFAVAFLTAEDLETFIQVAPIALLGFAISTHIYLYWVIMWMLALHFLSLFLLSCSLSLSHTFTNRLVTKKQHELIILLSIACQSVWKESFTDQELIEAQEHVNNFKKKFVEEFRDKSINTHTQGMSLDSVCYYCTVEIRMKRG